jgi:hypothetical protein
MIGVHQFNSEWWGKPAGILWDAAFFRLPAGEQQKALADFAWVEFRAPMEEELPVKAIHDGGFFLADTQIGFRIGLNDVSVKCDSGVEIRSAEEPGWSLDSGDWADFAHERFQHLAGCTPRRLQERYGRWAENTSSQHPGSSLRILFEGRTEAWFLAEPVSADSINLALCVQRRGSRISGMLAYICALARFREMGFRIGHASFSVRNTAVHNIYARLGARFVAPTAIWLWQAPKGDHRNVD